jgi:hypothetical protein
VLVVALVLFAIAAAGGLVMAVLRVRSAENPPLAIAALHGVLAATGLVLAILTAVNVGFSSLTGAGVGILVLAALGGFYLIATHLRGEVIPLPIVGIHAVAAVSGFLLLVAAAVGLA